MSSNVTLPRLGQGMETGTIVRWLKSEGENVEKGEPLYELDTEKVTQEVEAESSGVLLKILAGEGEEIEVGKAIAVIGQEGEDISAESVDSAEGEAEDPTKVTEEEPVEEGQPGPDREEERERVREDDEPAPKPEVSEQRQNGGRIKASPLARRIARERGIELSALRGTGPEGRIVAEDVERASATGAVSVAPAAAAAAPSGEIEVVKLNQMRKTIARRMTEAWEAPAFQISMSADMTASIRLREALLAKVKEGGVRPTYSDILTKVVALALMRHRDVNAHFAGDWVQLFPTANIGIAVAVPHGLVVPVIQGCERLTIPEIAGARADIVSRTREGKLRAEDLDGGTFTISNLGMYGVERFTAVLNPPQAGILAVGAIEERAVVLDGDFEIQPRMDMTLTIDHRSVDGATASEFLATVKSFLEEPGLAL
ncbi:MAG TPA: dihydrolipoamide acetyltransferase family protein [Gaiellaceae bacterium]|nr:dihydrolipoamide acetyltransferase family protein [Gaiellaceae bacterium]